MCEHLKGIIIEGDDQAGYHIAFIFKKIAMDYLSNEQKKEIRYKVSLYLMTPKNKIINADDAIDAIYYAIMAGKPINAILWTSMLLLRLERKSITREQYKYLLDRLNIVEVLNYPTEKRLKISYFMTLLHMAMIYTNIEEFEKANNMFKKLLENPLEQKDIPEELTITAEQIKSITGFLMVLNLMQLEDYSTAMKTINAIDAKSFIDLLHKELKGSKSLMMLIERCKLDNFPKDFVKRLVNCTPMEDDELIGELASCFCGLGIVAYRAKDYTSLKNILKEEKNIEMPLWDLFAKMAYAHYELLSGNAEKGLEITDRILNLVDSLNIQSNRLMLRIYQVRGDAFYKIEDYEDALKEYGISLSLLSDDTKLFDYAWNNYRMGLCTLDDQKAIDFFDNASNCFEELGYLNLKARSDGEKAVALYRTSIIKEACHLLNALIDGYYINNNQEYGPATTIGTAISQRILSELEGKPLEQRSENGRVWPKIERRVFSEALDEARPEAGTCVAYYTLSQIYKHFNEKDNIVNCLRTAFEADPKNLIENKFIIMSGLQLIELLIKTGNSEEAIEIIDNLFTKSKGDELPDERLYVFYIFNGTEELLKQGKLSVGIYKDIIEAVEKSINKLVDIRKYWWLAEVNKRKAGVDGITDEKDYNPKLMFKAWRYAMKSVNYNVMMISGNQIGFRYFRMTQSFKEISEIHLSVVLSICKGSSDISQIEKMGWNLMNFWSQITYKRLTETDFPYLKNLRDRAKSIIAKTPQQLHAPLMILFLVIVNNVEDKEEYKNARLWAIEKLKDNLDKIPVDEYEYIKYIL